MNAFTIQTRFLPTLIVLTLATLFLPTAVIADPPSTLPEDACQLRWEDDELCGWASATHDSIAYRYVPPAEPASASDMTVDGSITQGAAIAFASAGISVEQLLEPLAMVTPYIDNSLEKVRQYQSWWGAAVATAERMRQEDEDRESDVNEQLSRIAAEEPIDIESYGPSVIVDAFPTTQFIPEGEPGIEILPLKRNVGSTAIIVTIEDSYMPYDLADKDLRLWSVLPESTRPFCIRDSEHGWDAEPHFQAASLWRQFDAQVASSRQVNPDPPVAEPIESPEVLAYCGAADCLLDEWIWRTENFVADDAPLWDIINANKLGRRITSVAIMNQRVTEIVTTAIASRWEKSEPKTEQTIEPSDAGKALLTRAGAIVAGEPVIEVAASANSLR